MHADPRNPFEVYEAMCRLRAACKQSMYVTVYHSRDPRVKEALERHATAMRKIGESIRAVDGCCSAHVDILWWGELTKFKWWQWRAERKFIDDSAEWKRNKTEELRAAARSIKELELV